jgi:thymidylate synthase (FAD)
MKAEYYSHMGTDHMVCDMARASFDQLADNFPPEKNRSLIKFLATGFTAKDWEQLTQQVIECNDADEAFVLLRRMQKHALHFAPFAHPQITIRETVPIFIARQRFKHNVGFTYNEVSRRYVDDAPKFFTPDTWRARPENGIKQGSGDREIETVFYEISPIDGTGVDLPTSDTHTHNTRTAEDTYNRMIKAGVAPELARMELPQSMLTSYYVTGSLAAWARAYNQRIDPHAQVEIQQLARQWGDIVRPLFPISWEALTS